MKDGGTHPTAQGWPPRGCSWELTCAGASPLDAGTKVPHPSPHRHSIAGARHKTPQRQAGIVRAQVNKTAWRALAALLVPADPVAFPWPWCWDPANSQGGGAVPAGDLQRLWCGGPWQRRGRSGGLCGVWDCDSPSPLAAKPQPQGQGTWWPELTCVACGACGGSAQSRDSVHLGAGPRPVERDLDGTRWP